MWCPLPLLCPAASVAAPSATVALWPEAKVPGGTARVGSAVERQRRAPHHQRHLVLKYRG